MAPDKTTPRASPAVVLERLAWSDLVGLIFTSLPFFLPFAAPLLLPGVAPGYIYAIARGEPQPEGWSFFPTIDWQVALGCNALLYSGITYLCLSKRSKRRKANEESGDHVSFRTE